MKNRIRYKKFNTNFSTNGVSEPVVEKLFGKYNGRVENGVECELKWNKKHTILKNVQSLPTKTMDRLFSSSPQTKIKIFHHKGAKYRYTKGGIKYTSLNGRLNIHTKWLRKNPGINSRWIPV